MENLNLVLPEIFISLSIMFLLVLGVFKKDSSKITFILSLFSILITGQGFSHHLILGGRTVRRRCYSKLSLLSRSGQLLQ